ncbi:hypothetical protein, partial [Escherichia coli]|uniref:hypothetical protein n=1 Tax=Escherichia coli TaxID=562 RepID=UPI001BDB71D4
THAEGIPRRATVMVNAGIIKNDAHRVFTALMIRGFIPVRWWKKQEAVLQKVLLLYPDAMYVM